MPRRKLTETFAARVSSKARVYYWDTRLPGFGLRVSGGASRRRTWVVRYRLAEGKPRELKLGVYPTVNATQARSEAMDQLRAIGEGQDPAQAKIEARSSRKLTMAKLCERFEAVRIGRMSDKTARMYRSMFKNHVLAATYGIGELPVEVVSREHVQALVDAIAEQRGRKGLRKVGQAKKVKSLVGMLTGVRVDEARLLVWADVRIEGGDPHLALRRRKTRKKKPVKTVPLSSVAEAILRRRGPGLPQGYVFPSPRCATPGDRCRTCFRPGRRSAGRPGAPGSPATWAFWPFALCPTSRCKVRAPGPRRREVRLCPC